MICAAARLSACCSRRSTLKSSARMGASISTGMCGMDWLQPFSRMSYRRRDWGVGRSRRTRRTLFTKYFRGVPRTRVSRDRSLGPVFPSGGLLRLQPGTLCNNCGSPPGNLFGRTSCNGSNRTKGRTNGAGNTHKKIFLFRDNLFGATYPVHLSPLGIGIPARSRATSFINRDYAAPHNVTLFQTQR